MACAKTCAKTKILQPVEIIEDLAQKIFRGFLAQIMHRKQMSSVLDENTKTSMISHTYTSGNKCRGFGNKCRAGKHYVIFDMGEIPCAHLQDVYQCSNRSKINSTVRRRKFHARIEKFFPLGFRMTGRCKGHSKAGNDDKQPPFSPRLNF